MDVPYAASPRAFTVAVSFRAEFVPQNIAIPGFVATCGDALSNGFAIRLQPQGEKYVLQLCMGDSRRKGRSVWITDTQPEIEPGAWCRAIVRWDGRRLLFAVEGTKVGEVDYDGEFVPAADGLLALNRARQGYHYFPIDIGEFRLSERAWEGREMEAFFAAKPKDDPDVLSFVRTMRRVAKGGRATVKELSVRCGEFHPLVEDCRNEALAFALLDAGDLAASIRAAETRLAHAAPHDVAERRFDFLPRYGAALRAKGHEALGRKYLAETYERLRDMDASTLPLAAHCYAKVLREVGDSDWAGWIERQASVLAEGTVWADILRDGGPVAAVPGRPADVKRPPSPSVRLFASPAGDDSAAGTFEAPVKTPERAFELLRAAVAKGTPVGGAALYFRGGTYPVRTTLVLADVAGTADAPVFIGSWQDEKPVFSGAVSLRACVEGAADARLPTEEARRNVRVYDLAASGVGRLPRHPPNGFGARMRAAPMLFEGDAALTLARHPNAGFLRTVAPQKFNRGFLTDKGYQHGDSFQGVKDGFLSACPELARFVHARDLMVEGYWTYYWADRSGPVKSVDPATGAVVMDLAGADEQPLLKSIAAQVPGNPYYFFNALEALDAPGEWYADRAAGKLYVWPKAAGDLRITALMERMLTLERLRNVWIDGLSFEGGAHDAIVARGLTNVVVAGCSVHGFAGIGLTVRAGFNVTIAHGVFARFGWGALNLEGGSRKTLSPGYVRLVDCEAYDCNLHHHVHPMCIVSGVGNEVRGCQFHDSLSSVFRVEGNDHLFVSNLVRRAVQECDDNGAVDVYRCPSYAGCKYLYNVFEDCGGGEIAECGQAAIRFDGNISGMTVYGNVIRRSGTCYFGAININGGRNNVIDSNRFEDCPLAVSTFFYPPWHWREIFEGTDKNARYVRDQTEGRINVRQPPYSTAYPRLAQIRHLPQFNFITRNRAVNGVVDPGCPAPTALYGNSSSDGAPAP